MAATVQIRELNGAGETGTDKTSGTIRFKKADNSTVDLNDPLTVPTSNTEYSYEKWLRLYVSGGTYTQISNLRAYTDGSSGWTSGAKCWYAVDGSYSTPVIPTVTNDPPQHDAVGMSDVFGATSGSPIDMDGTNTGPFDSTSLPKYVGDYLVLVAEVEQETTQGLQSSETLTMAWDEI